MNKPDTGMLKHRLYRLNALLLIVPLWFVYRTLVPEAAAEWPVRGIGPFTAAPMPADADPPYLHEDGYMKDFAVRLCSGCGERIRLAYLSVGERPAETRDGVDGILHGFGSLQHAHAPFPKQPGMRDKLWLTVQEWNGQLHHAAWPLHGGTD